MKKTNIIFGTLICTSLFIASCQQEKAVDPEVMDAKVKEAYEAKITEIDAEATAACEAKINEKVQSLKDSLSHVSAAQQAALMAKMQKDLEIAKKKAQAVAKKNVVNPTNNKKPVNPVDEKLNDRFNKSSEDIKKEAEKKATQTLDDRFNKSSEEIKKEAEKKADEKLKSRF